MRILTFAALLGVAACSSAQRPIALLGGPTRFDLTDSEMASGLKQNSQTLLGMVSTPPPILSSPFWDKMETTS